MSVGWLKVWVLSFVFGGCFGWQVGGDREEGEGGLRGW